MLETGTGWRTTWIVMAVTEPSLDRGEVSFCQQQAVPSRGLH